MIDAQNQKFVLLTPPQLKDNGALANNTYLDTVGWGRVQFLIATGAIDIEFGSTNTATALLVEQCDTTGGTYTAVNSAALAAVLDGDDDNEMHMIEVDLTKSHKRYMRVQAPTAGDGTAGVNACIIGILSDPIDLPDSATQRGLAEHIIV